MTCTNCGTENRPGAKFCSECATPLAAGCPTCGTVNPPTAKFCSECATPLHGARPADGSASDAASGAAPAGHAGADSPVAERRLVSILFADLVGFTTYSEGRDAEEVRELLTRYFELASDVVRRYGGTVEKFIGDAVMAVWGRPWRARTTPSGRFARRSSSSMPSRPSARDPGACRRPDGRGGRDIGATNQGMVAGDLVNTASRLQSAAAPGMVLVGETTQRAAAGAIAFEEAGEQTLKGKASRCRRGERSASSRNAAGGTAARRSRRRSSGGTRSCASSRTCSTPPGARASRGW